MLTPGTLIDGRFEIVELIGEGGMGTVYSARHKQMDRTIALKLLKANLIRDEEKIARFRNEARVLSSLQHPNIIAIHAIGLAETGQPYMAMDIVSGESLSDAISRRGYFEQDEALRICIEICAGLEYAHSHNIVHRDIKPSNIILSPARGGALVPKLVDFGIAKDLDSAAAQNLTQTGAAMGSVFYLSPGQFEGRAADPSSDIYALGCTLYEMLTGVPPFEADNFFEAAMRHHSAIAVPVNQRNPAANITPGVQNIINHMLEKEHHSRYQSGKHLREDLELALARKPLKHAPEHGQKQLVTADKNSRRDKRLKIVLVSVMSVIAIAIAYACFDSFSKRPVGQALSATAEAEDALDLARRNLHNFWDSPEEAAKEVEICRRAVCLADKTNDPLLRARAYRFLAEAGRASLASNAAKTNRRLTRTELQPLLQLLESATNLSNTAYKLESNSQRRWNLELERYLDQHEFVMITCISGDFASAQSWEALLKYLDSVKHRSELSTDYRPSMIRLTIGEVNHGLRSADPKRIIECIQIRTKLLRLFDTPQQELLAESKQVLDQLKACGYSPNVLERARQAYVGL